jgi:CRISPR-associated protein Cmr1
MKLKLKTLTPIWTGDIDRDSSTLKESSLIGSLRLWCEGIIRGMGGYACTAIQNGNPPCPASPNSNVPNELCPVCQLFGCTGWARRFRLSADGMQALPLFFVSHQQAYIGNANWLYRMFGGSDLGSSKEKRGRDMKFQFGVQMLWSDGFSLTVLPRFSDSVDTINMLAYLFSVISRCGSLGAKGQNGFGIVKLSAIEGISKDAIERGRKMLIELADKSKETFRNQRAAYEQNRSKGKHGNPGLLFDLQDCFVRNYEIKDPAPYQGVGRVIGTPQNKLYPSRLIPIAFDIRYKSSSKNPFTGQGRDFGLRPFLKNRFDSETINLLLGETRPRNVNARSASRIYVSHLFRELPTEKYKLRIGGSVPPAIGISISEVVTAIDEFICGREGMFPGSTVHPVDVSREVLGL